jgi:NitT/TauT family transport system permease protein/taurine transport system permease protein
VFAAILMILALSIMFDVLARMVERRTAVWQTAGRRAKASGNDVQAVPAGAPA